MAGHRAPLSRDRILQAALTLVDRDGLEAISMRRVGEALGVEAMSLYNHVASKAALLDGLFELVLAELPSAGPAVRWRPALRERALALRAALAAHPNALPLFTSRPAVTPAALAHVERVLEVLRTAGFSVDEALSVLQCLVAFVVGHTVSTRGPRIPREDARPGYALLGEVEFLRVREAALTLAAHDVEEEFALGLDAFLDGFAARLRRSRHPPGAAPHSPLAGG
jgi:AcrR family transcriptional regulator